ncbi:MAG TPA: PIN domain-containing protein [Methanomassiliicoccales archaeon]|jgi:predicted nucleic acid-binding protein
MTKSRIFLDSNVILDVTVEATTRESQASVELFKALDAGRLEAMVITPVITEVYYITFEETANEDRAISVIDGLACTKGIEVIAISDIVAEKAGCLMSKYNYDVIGKRAIIKPQSDRLSIVDSLILAASSVTADSIVCSHERKFKNISEVTTKTPRELMSGR